MVFPVQTKLSAIRFLALLVCVQAWVVSPSFARECILHPDSLNPDAGWALNRVGEEFSAEAAYTYPETTTPVRLYLIDTAISNPASFVAANPKLTFEGTILVRGSNDPMVSTPRAHGTQMLSLIAGVETGAAPGTPIHVVNFDIYPNETTTTSLLSKAIIQAIAHHRNSANPMRAVICIATSSTEQTSSYIIGDSINVAVAEGITVVLSAGNLGRDAANIVPSSNGTKNGVICVGASDENDLVLPSSNYGAPVDILAPGSDVRSLSESATSAFVPMSGTSPAAALVAGAVLAKLSASPTHTPAGIESALKTAAEAAAAGPHFLRSIVAPTSDSAPPDVVPDGPITSPSNPIPLTWSPAIPESNSFIQASSFAESASPAPAQQATNSNEESPIIKTFHQGNNPAHSGMPMARPVANLSANREMKFSFPVASDLFDGTTPFTLRNGYSWGIRCSTNLSNWTVPVGTLSKSTDPQGRVWLTATFPAAQPACFASIEIIAP